MSRKTPKIGGVWFLTTDESKRWCEGRDWTLDERGHPVLDFAHRLNTQFSHLNWSRLNWFAGFLVSQIDSFDNRLLWVTQWGVWPSSENFHLVYRLRESYGERRPLWEAPGHEFLKHETSDLATHVQLALLCGWDFYVVNSAPSSVAIFVSHDEFVEFNTNHAEKASEIKAALDTAKLAVTVER